VSTQQSPGVTDAEQPMRRRLVLLLGALASFGPLSIDMYLPALPRIAGSLHATTSSVQLTLTACTVGLGVGQLVAGPLSDNYGRRRPLLIGLVAFAVFSAGCAAAPTLPVLLGCRFLQALGGSAGIVIARAIARDLRSGAALARLFSVLMVVNGAAPILAPVIGAQLVRFTSWRGVFVVLAGLGVLLLIASVVVATETLPADRRRRGGVHAAFATYRRLLADPVFVGLVLAGAFAFAAMFTYISGSPFILEEHFGLSPQLFSAVFALNALGIVAGSRIRLRSIGATMLSGLVVIATGALAGLSALSFGMGLALLLPGFFLVTLGFGMVAPNSTALALADHPDAAGSAAAVYGACQFLIGGLLAPLGGLGGRPATVTVVLAGCALVGLTVGAWAVRSEMRRESRRELARR